VSCAECSDDGQGKDPSKVDRSGAYAARWIAKAIVASCLARKATVQLSYAIGLAEPISIVVDTDGTGTVPDEIIADAIQEVFDLSPAGIIEALQLKRPIVHSHFLAWAFRRVPR
jgi:S-adenosylmethionine synthetase